MQLTILTFKTKPYPKPKPNRKTANCQYEFTKPVKNVISDHHNKQMLKIRMRLFCSLSPIIEIKIPVNVKTRMKIGPATIYMNPVEILEFDCIKYKVYLHSYLVLIALPVVVIFT